MLKLLFLAVEANLASWLLGRGRKEGLQFGPDGAQRRVVFEQRLINLRKPFENGRVGGELLAHLHEGPHHKYAHGHGFGAVQDGGGHDGAVFGKGMGAMPDISLGCGRNLRPHGKGFLGFSHAFTHCSL